MLLAVSVDADGAAGREVRGGPGQGVGFVVGGAELEAGGGGEDAAFESVVGLADLDRNDNGGCHNGNSADGDADNLALGRADGVVAGVAGAAGGSAADEQ